MEVFAREGAAQGLTPWTLADVTAPAKHRLYRATVTEHWVLGPARRAGAGDRPPRGSRAGA